MKSLKYILLSSILSLFSCDFGFQSVGGGEHAVIFSSLPRFLGGGVKTGNILSPGEKEFILPWEKIYKYNSTVISISWIGSEHMNDQSHTNSVETRTLDGNEVMLSITVRYRINPEMLPHIVQYVGIDDAAVRRVVYSLARSDIRTHTNTLKTSGFFNPVARDAALKRVKEALNSRLKDEGIIVEDVIYVDHKFERRLSTGEIDHSYQEQIDMTQALVQETQKEEKNVQTVREQKNLEFNQAQGEVNRMIEEASGLRRQLIFKGDSYFEQKKNEAEKVLAIGNSEVESLREKIKAYDGPGGKALLKLEIAKALKERNPNFLLLNHGSSSVDLNRTDTNQLLKDAKIIGMAGEINREMTSEKTKGSSNLETKPITETPNK